MQFITPSLFYSQPQENLFSKLCSLEIQKLALELNAMQSIQDCLQEMLKHSVSQGAMNNGNQFNKIGMAEEEDTSKKGFFAFERNGPKNKPIRGSNDKTTLYKLFDQKYVRDTQTSNDSCTNDQLSDDSSARILEKRIKYAEVLDQPEKITKRITKQKSNEQAKPQQTVKAAKRSPVATTPKIVRKSPLLNIICKCNVGTQNGSTFCRTCFLKASRKQRTSYKPKDVLSSENSKGYADSLMETEDQLTIPNDSTMKFVKLEPMN